MGRFGAPSLITRTTNDVQQVQMLIVMAAAILVSAPIMWGGIVMGVHVASGLAWVLVVAVPILGGAMAVLISKMVPGFRAMQDKLDAINRCCASRSPASGWCGRSSANATRPTGSPSPTTNCRRPRCASAR